MRAPIFVVNNVKMKTNYTITGMTCGGCVTKVNNTIASINGVESVHVQLDNPQAVIESSSKISLQEIQSALSKVGNYQISENQGSEQVSTEISENVLITYKPLLMIVAFITGFSLLVQYPFNDFSVMLWMRHFMAGFFVVFAFFKLLNTRGFADSYAMYDIVAAKWRFWGYIYPYIELLLGVSYLLNFNPILTNLFTIIVLGVSSVGVIKSNLDKRKIRCACLGDVFNLPMSKVTIIEDLSMVAMAIGMLIWMTV